MDIIKVKETFQLPSGRKFFKGDTFFGHWNYYSNLYKSKENVDGYLPLVIIVPNDGPWLLSKEYFELSM